jgi:hypothetical protein
MDSSHNEHNLLINNHQDQFDQQQQVIIQEKAPQQKNIIQKNNQEERISDNLVHIHHNTMDWYHSLNKLHFKDKISDQTQKYRNQKAHQEFKEE